MPYIADLYVVFVEPEAGWHNLGHIFRPRRGCLVLPRDLKGTNNSIFKDKTFSRSPSLLFYNKSRFFFNGKTRIGIPGFSKQR
jgi:hypothetical protein